MRGSRGSSARSPLALAGRLLLAATMVSVGLVLAARPSMAVEFCNSTPIVGKVGQPTFDGPDFPSNPYPSPIVVSGLSGTVTDVNVRLLGFTAYTDLNGQSYPDDIDVLLVAPNNTSNVVIMSDVAGQNLQSNPVNGVNLTLDDAAASPLPADDPAPGQHALPSGTYKPFDDDNDPGEVEGRRSDPFAAPAPAPASPSGVTSLATFNGLSSAGTWNLYVGDDTYLAKSDFDGWCIDITTTGGATTTPPPADFDGDRDTDFSVFRPSAGVWFVKGDTPEATVYGTQGDIPVPADYDGDGITDIAVFRPGGGFWFIQKSSGGQEVVPYGTQGDVPAPGDYNRDGLADIAVFRPNFGLWFIHNSGGGDDTVAWGANGDIPVVGDYDGDDRADLAVFRPSAGIWYVRNSSGGQAFTAHGTAGDVPVPGDYDGDGRTDVAVFRPSGGHWFVNASGGASSVQAYGVSGDVPVPGDYDGNGRTDVAVFRPSSGHWFVDGGPIVPWGTNGDIPLPLPPSIYGAAFPPGSA